MSFTAEMWTRAGLTLMYALNALTHFEGDGLYECAKRRADTSKYSVMETIGMQLIIRFAAW